MYKSLPFRWVLFLIFGIFVVGCQRPKLESSSISIHIPTHSEFKMAQEKVGVMAIGASAIDYSKLCFAVNVKGDGIPSKVPKTCDIERGNMIGSVAPGGQLSLEVNLGTVRFFEVYGMLRESASDACPTNLETSWKWALEKVYFLGKTDAVNIDKAEVQVPVTITLPAPADHLISVNSLPASCRSAPEVAPTSGRIADSAEVLSGQQFKAYSRVSFKENTKHLKGNRFQIHNWRANNK